MSRAKGEGSVFKLASGKWRAQVRYYDAAGKRKSITRTCKTKAEAVEQLAKLHENAGSLVGTLTDQTVAEYLDEWHKLRKETEKIRPKTTVTEARHIERIKSVLGQEKVEKLQRKHVFELLDRLDGGELRGKARTLQQIRTTFSRALKDAVSRGRLGHNPAKDIEHDSLRAATRPKIAKFTNDQLRSILGAVDLPLKDGGAPDTEFACLIYLLANSGLRIGEALALRWRFVDLKVGAVRVEATLVETSGVFELGPPKTEAGRRTVHLDPETLRRLAAQRGTLGNVVDMDALVFPTRSGRPQRISNVLRRRWHPLLERVGIKTCGFHVLRHTHASALIVQGGADPATVAMRLGHEDAGVTLSVYAHSDEGAEAKLAGVLADVIAINEEDREAEA